jgi:predicted nucleotidyltransferase
MDKKISKAISKIKEYQVLIPYLGDYGARFHIREIARKMKMNHRTAAMALERLEAQEIVKHTISGRNKLYFLNLDNPYTRGFIRDVESYMHGRLLSVPIIKELYHSIMQPPFPFTPIIIFGSYAKGENTEDSDIDLLLLEKNEKILKAVKKFELRYDKKVHVNVFSPDELLKGLKEKEPLFLEIAESHVILNNQEAFVSILWRHFCG